jgi:predicted MarR family transcription regulator
MPGDKGEPVNWPIAPRLVDLSLVEYRVLKLICNGYSLAKEIVKGYASRFNEAISLQAIERTLVKLRVKGLVNGKRSGRALAYEETQLGRLVACS